MKLEDVKRAMIDDVELSKYIRLWLKSDAELHQNGKYVCAGSVDTCLATIAYKGGEGFTIEEV